MGNKGGVWQGRKRGVEGNHRRTWGEGLGRRPFYPSNQCFNLIGLFKKYVDLTVPMLFPLMHPFLDGTTFLVTIVINYESIYKCQVF